MPGVLDGIRVLDFGRYIAGPWCAGLLGDFGAEVIRVEKVDGGEDRFVCKVSEADDSGAMFLQVNRNKKCMTLDPTTREGRAVQRRLVATADIVVANMPQRALEKLGLDYAALSRIRPDIILVSNTCFGSAGPYSRRLGFDGLAQAMCGNMHLTGDPDTPMKSYSPWVDFGTATLCALGAVIALMARQQTGKGQEVQGALLSTALTTASPSLIEQAVNRPNRIASGNRGQLNAPSDVFATRDGHIMILVSGAPMYRRWAKLVGESRWLEDDRFRTDDSRGEHGEIFSARMADWCAERTTDGALSELEAARVPAGPVYTPQQALDDPQVLDGGFLMDADYPGTPSVVPLVATPVRLLGTPGEIRLRAPLLGEHTDEILTELGYSVEGVERLRAARVV
jgi:crotonobetainyl-CoA:carnitine CoA-transferase CaiB-like acyl-CoA transferase